MFTKTGNSYILDFGSWVFVLRVSSEVVVFVVHHWIYSGNKWAWRLGFKPLSLRYWGK